MDEKNRKDHLAALWKESRTQRTKSVVRSCTFAQEAPASVLSVSNLARLEEEQPLGQPEFSDANEEEDEEDVCEEDETFEFADEDDEVEEFNDFKYEMKLREKKLARMSLRADSNSGEASHDPANSSTCYYI